MLKLITTSLKRRFENVENITTAELHNNINNSNNILLIDTRNEEEYSVSRLPGARHLHFQADTEQISRFIQDHVKNKEDNSETLLICYCSLGYRSSVLAQKISALEINNIKVYNLEGSIFKWANENRTLDGGDGVHPFSYMWGFLGLNFSKWKWTN